MIRINILRDFTGGASEDLVQIEEQENIQINLFKRFILVILGPIALYGYELYNLPILEQKHQALQAALSVDKKYNDNKAAISAEIAKWKDDQNRLDRQITFLRMIEQERHVSRDIILEIQKIIPDQVWIKSLTAEFKQLRIEGEGVEQADILEFNKRLENLSFLKDVNLPEVRPTNSGGSVITTYGYEIKADIESSGNGGKN